MSGLSPVKGVDSPSRFPHAPEGAKRVLLVDDEDGIRRVLRLLLEDMGYEVVEASQGEEALARFDGGPFSVVLTDIKMPVMDGISLLKEVKTLCSGCEVIMLTGHGDLSLAIESLRAGAIDFITKPVNDDLLEMALEKAFSSVGLKYELKQHTQHLEELVAEKGRALIEAESMAAVGEAVSEVAHAIKGISSALSAGLYVVEEGLSEDDTETIRSGWGVISRNVHRSGRLAKNLLHAGNSCELIRTPVNLADVITEAGALAELRAKTLGVEIILSLPQDPCVITGDGESLLIALTNVLENALDAMEDRDTGGLITMELTQQAGRITISVADTAGGMDEGLRQQAFTRKVSTRKWKGTGIGMMVTARIAEAHGAELALVSNGTTGTRVSLVF